MQANNYTASCLDRSPTTTSLFSLCLPLPSIPFVVVALCSARTTDGDGEDVDRSPRTAGHAHRSSIDDMMSHRRLGRVVSDLSHSNSRSVTTTDHSLHHQSATTTTSNNNEGGNVGKAAKQKLSLLISSVVAWTRSGETGGSREKNSSRRSSRKQQTNGGGTGGRRRRGLDIVLAVRKYVAMVEQLFVTSSSYSASSRSWPDADSRRRDGRPRPHTFTSVRHAAGGNASTAAQSSSKRHRGRLSSAPASLRGSPATSGHLSVGESVTKLQASTSSSEASTMEDLQSAIQAAIAHCKNSVAVAGGDKQQQVRKC